VLTCEQRPVRRTRGDHASPRRRPPPRRTDAFLRPHRRRTAGRSGSGRFVWEDAAFTPPSDV
jgi:hypothetical protein